MTTRVDPEAYRDTPIFRGLLRERDGRWPGIPEGDDYDPLLEEMTTALEEMSAQRPPAMFRVMPIPSMPQHDSEETATMALPALSED